MCTDRCSCDNRYQSVIPMSSRKANSKHTIATTCKLIMFFHVQFYISIESVLLNTDVTSIKTNIGSCECDKIILPTSAKHEEF